MDHIARFEISDEKLADSPRAVQEFNAMASATDTMKAGLRSFSKYVPHQLVRKLLRTGGEASLGGEVSELTVGL